MLAYTEVNHQANNLQVNLPEQIRTVGYRQKNGLAEIKRIMHEDHTTILVDIRYEPKSKNHVWTQEAFMQQYGGRYRWVRDLGNELYKEHGKIKIHNASAGINELLLLLKRHNIILMCGCEHYEQCHRKSVYELLTGVLAAQQAEHDQPDVTQLQAKDTHPVEDYEMLARIVTEISIQHEELQQQHAYAIAHIQNQQETIDLLEERDHQQLERIAELEERAELYQSLHSNKSNEHEDFKKWIYNLFANKTIPVAAKIVLLFFFMKFHGETGREKHITMLEAAAITGYNEDTVRKACNKLDMFNITNRRYEDLILEDGTKYSKGMVYFTLDPVVANPDRIEMENRHGGERHRKCAKCGSENIDRYTVQYCRECNENDWYFQPATRNDAPWEKAQKAENRLPYGKGKKQDAFESPKIEAPTEKTKTQDEPISANIKQEAEITHEPETKTSITNNNQDAFTQGEPETSEEQYTRYDSAQKLLTEIESYGYTLDYLSNGKRQLKHNASTTKVPAQTSDRIRAQIQKYNTELHQIWQDCQYSQNAQQPTSSPDVTQPQAKDTHSQKQDAFTPEPLCDICHQREAKGTLYQHGEAHQNYCLSCKPKVAVQLDAQHSNTYTEYGKLRNYWGGNCND